MRACLGHIYDELQGVEVEVEYELVIPDTVCIDRLQNEIRKREDPRAIHLQTATYP
jgi:hypothetical protein